MKPFAIVASILLAQVSVSTVAHTAPPKPEPRKEWPIEAFAELPLMERPQLSPDGLRIAARVAVDGELMLMIASIVD